MPEAQTITNIQALPEWLTPEVKKQIEAARELFMHQHKGMAFEENQRLVDERERLIGVVNEPTSTPAQKKSASSRIHQINNILSTVSGVTLTPEQRAAKIAEKAEFEAELASLSPVTRVQLPPLPFSRGVKHMDIPNPKATEPANVARRFELERKLAAINTQLLPPSEFTKFRTDQPKFEEPVTDAGGNIVYDVETGLPKMKKIPRVVMETPEGDMRAFETKARQMATDTEAQEALGRAAASLGTVPSATAVARPYIERGVAAPSEEEIAKFKTPFDDVIRKVETESERITREKLLPQLRSGYKGINYNQGHRLQEEQRLLRDIADQNKHSLAQFGAQNMREAMEMAAKQKGKELEAGKLMGLLQGEEEQRVAQKAGILSNLAAQKEALKLGKADIQEKLAEKKLARLQKSTDVAYQDLLRQEALPLLRAAQYGSVIKGLPYPTEQVSVSIPGAEPAPNLGTVLGGALTTAAGLAARNRPEGAGIFKKGGLVKRAQGGSMIGGEPYMHVSDAEVEPYLQSPELESARQHYAAQKAGNRNPLWSGLTRLGIGMMQQGAAGRGGLEAIGHAAPQFLSGYEAEDERQRAMAENEAKFNLMLHESRLQQKNAMLKHKLSNEQFKMRRSEHAEKMNLLRAKSEMIHDELSPAQMKRERELDDKINASLDEYHKLISMNDKLPKIHTGTLGGLYGAVSDYLPSMLGGTGGDQGAYEKEAEELAQARAKAIGGARVTNKELESARETVPASKKPREAIKKIMSNQSRDIQRRIQNLLAQKKRPFEGDLSLLEKNYIAPPEDHAPVENKRSSPGLTLEELLAEKARRAQIAG